MAEFLLPYGMFMNLNSKHGFVVFRNMWICNPLYTVTKLWSYKVKYVFSNQILRGFTVLRKQFYAVSSKFNYITYYKQLLIHSCKAKCKIGITLIWSPNYYIVISFLYFQRLLVSWLRAHTCQKWKNRFLSCPCPSIYRVEVVGLKSSNYTLKITIFVSMWNFGQFREKNDFFFCQ